MYLFYRIGKRKTSINKALPDALDLLVICMEAGLGIDQATLRIGKEIEEVYPELSEELSIIGYEQRAGKPRLEAWRSMSDRVDLDTVRQFVAMLVQTDKLGTPIARALGQFADGLRTKRLLMAEEQAAKTTVKLIFPLGDFYLPGAVHRLARSRDTYGFEGFRRAVNQTQEILRQNGYSNDGSCGGRRAGRDHSRRNYSQAQENVV